MASVREATELEKEKVESVKEDVAKTAAAAGVNVDCERPSDQLLEELGKQIDDMLVNFFGRPSTA